MNLAILAPITYYKKYDLIDNDLTFINLDNINGFFKAASDIFQTKIQIIAIDWSEGDLLNICSTIQPKPLKENVVVSVKGYSIDALKQENLSEIYSTE